MPGHRIYIASGIDQGFIKRIALLPLLRDLSTITAIALFIILCTWWFATAFVNRRVRPLLLALQRIGSSEWTVRTGLADCGGEIGAIARGVDDMAENLQTHVAAQQTAERDRKLIEQHYQELIEQAVEGVTVRRVTGEYVLVNAAFCKMLGYSHEQLLRMRITDVIEHSEQRGHLLNIGESVRFESWMYHQDGHRVPVEVSTLRLQNGNIQSVQRDIGERLEARRKLEDSERHYRELVEQAMVGILVRRPAGEILFVNEALCRMTGYSREELLHMPVTSLVDPAEADAIQYVKRVGEDEILRLQSRLRHKDGSIIHEELSARRLEDGNIQLIINDITARVKAEQRFADERDFVFHALDTLPGVFYVFDSRGKFLRWNRQMEEITGYSQKEMRHITSADIVPPDRRAAHVQLV
ncbi:MAG: PAS domain-containing protein, partial [Gammaproteobacteria bacterium]